MEHPTRAKLFPAKYQKALKSMGRVPRKRERVILNGFHRKRPRLSRTSCPNFILWVVSDKDLTFPDATSAAGDNQLRKWSRTPASSTASR